MTAAAPTNPLLQDWTASGGLPPFDALHAEHFAPAFDLALGEHRAELDAIAALTEPPSFENTVAAFDASGRRLRRLEHAFHNLAASQSTPALQAVERELAPRLAAHDSAVHAHAGLFARLEALHERREAQGLLEGGREVLRTQRVEGRQAAGCGPVLQQGVGGSGSHAAALVGRWTMGWRRF